MRVGWCSRGPGGCRWGECNFARFEGGVYRIGIIEVNNARGAIQIFETNSQTFVREGRCNVL